MKKLSTMMSMDTETSYRKFISEKVLSDREILNFIRSNNFTREDVEENLEKFYQYYISKDSNLNLNHRPKLVYRNNELYIDYIETEEYKLYRQSLELSQQIKTEFMPSKVLTYTFENLSRSSEKSKLAREIIRVCDSILERKTTRGIYIYGPTGIGKTYLMGCIYNFFKKNDKEPAIVYFPEFVRKVKAKISTNDYDVYIDLLREQEILIIDDIGAENITEFIRDEVLGPIINYREAENLPTFFSSNLSFEDLAVLLSNSKNSVDQTKGIRIVERIKSLSSEKFLDGENEREYYNR